MIESFRSFLYEKVLKKGTYLGCRFSPDTVKNIISLQREMGVPNPVPQEKLHSTILYSRKYLPKLKPDQSEYPIRSDDTKFRLELWESQSGAKCLVLVFDCISLVEYHKWLMKQHNATYDYDEYKPHITLSYDVGDDWFPNVSTISFKDNSQVTISSEYIEDLDLDWAENNT